MEGCLSKMDPLPESLIRRARAFSAELYGTPIGLMALRGELSELEYKAAAAYDRAHSEYLRAIDAKTLRAAGNEVGIGGTPHDVGSAPGIAQAAREAKAVARYDELHRVTVDSGVQASMHFEAVVIGGVTPDFAMRTSVRRICKALEIALSHRRKDARNDGRSNRRKFG